MCYSHCWELSPSLALSFFEQKMFIDPNRSVNKSFIYTNESVLRGAHLKFTSLPLLYVMSSVCVKHSDQINNILALGVTPLLLVRGPVCVSVFVCEHECIFARLRANVCVSAFLCVCVCRGFDVGAFNSLSHYVCS